MSIPACAGNRSEIDGIPPRPGSIPACAGEPLSNGFSLAKGRVYPRVCGGTMQELSPRAWPRGLSPRVRGNRNPKEVSSMSSRSIPACAGEPRRYRVISRGRRVYPRVCGGTAMVGRDLPSQDGLSPRVRGNRAYDKAAWGRYRSIPACAGEPTGRGIPTPWSGVYPRVCGGTVIILLGRRWEMGLSPRVRGNPRKVKEGVRGVGSIPACAGEPWRW